jgi:guanine deaminase
MNHKDLRPISLSEAFYMATKGGGQYFGLHGSFEKDYCSDLMIVKPDPIESIKPISPIESLEKFIYTNDHSRILKIYAKGKCLIDKNTIK